MLHQAVDILRNLDSHLASFSSTHGVWVYAVLFAIIFAETGLVIFPFLPGDSLLFTVGALAARGIGIDLWVAIGLMIVAAVLGDFVNYHLGKYLGPRIFGREVHAEMKPSTLERLLSRKHLDRANAFYARYGGKAVVLGRFVPIVRTFVPFVAGAGAMDYRKFVLFNVVGAIAWVGICTLAGYYFGNFAWVKANFEALVLGIIAVSLLPVLVEFTLARRRAVIAASTRGSV